MQSGIPGVVDLGWAAYDFNGSSWISFDLEFSLNSIYQVQYTINPLTSTYTALVVEVDASGNLITAGDSLNLTFSSQAVSNNKNGQITFHVEGSAGDLELNVDNINIQGFPEPGSSTLLLIGLGALVLRHRWAAKVQIG